jgi:hypothetical protein
MAELATRNEVGMQDDLVRHGRALVTAGGGPGLVMQISVEPVGGYGPCSG